MKHLLCTIHGPVDDEKMVKNALLQACRAAGALIVGVQDHSFYPLGYSAAVLLGESHATVHTWPEKRDAIVDYFSCAEDPKLPEFINEWSRCGFVVVHKQEIDRIFEE